MGKVIDLIGQKFGRLTVIKRSFPNNKWKDPMWLCKCDCGTEKIIIAAQLKNGKTQSCGCLQKEIIGNRYKLNIGQANLRKTIGFYKSSAKKRGLKWGLTEKQFEEITQKDCHYCGTKPNNICKSKLSNGDYIYNGIDRVDNTKGYIIDNVVPCCIKCNKTKGKSTIKEFKAWVKRVHNKMFVLREVT